MIKIKLNKLYQKPLQPQPARNRQYKGDHPYEFNASLCRCGFIY